MHDSHRCAGFGGGGWQAGGGGGGLGGGGGQAAPPPPPPPRKNFGQLRFFGQQDKLGQSHVLKKLPRFFKISKRQIFSNLFSNTYTLKFLLY